MAGVCYDKEEAQSALAEIIGLAIMITEGLNTPDRAKKLARKIKKLDGHLRAGGELPDAWGWTWVRAGGVRL